MYGISDHESVEEANSVFAPPSRSLCTFRTGKLETNIQALSSNWTQIALKPRNGVKMILRIRLDLGCTMRARIERVLGKIRSFSTHHRKDMLCSHDKLMRTSGNSLSMRLEEFHVASSHRPSVLFWTVVHSEWTTETWSSFSRFLKQVEDLFLWPSSIGPTWTICRTVSAIHPKYENKGLRWPHNGSSTSILFI